MADESTMSPPRASTSPRLPALLGRIGVWCTILTALILTAVVAANILMIGLHVPSNGAFAWIVVAGPPVGVLLSTAASYLGYYGTWRIVRGKDEYDVVDDLKGHAADLPSNLQNQPVALMRHLGCASTFSTAALAASLVATGLTMAPPPYRALGVIPTNGGFAPAGLGVTVSNANAARSTTPHPTATLAPTTTSSSAAIVRFVVSPTAYSGDCGHGTLPAQKITLDNSGSTVAAPWTVTIRETIPGATRLWAKASKSTGSVAAGQTDTFQLTPDGSLCKTVPRTGATYHADITLGGGLAGRYTVTATIAGGSR